MSENRTGGREWSPNEHQNPAKKLVLHNVNILGHMIPYVWQEPFPLDIQEDLVGFANPTGMVTNSNLEQAAVLAQLDSACQVTNCEHVIDSSMLIMKVAMSA